MFSEENKMNSNLQKKRNKKFFYRLASSYANMVLQVKYLFWDILHLKEQKNFVNITLCKH